MENESTIIDYKMEYNNNSSKEILSNLLKKMLDHKITKLEKRHKEETNALRTMSKISQNIIISLQNYTKEVKKEIYKIRHKYDENNQKKNENKSSEKNDILNSDINIESFIESKENILEKSNINNISNIDKIKRGSKSIDAKKAKELFLSPETSQKKMIKIKREKTDVFSRLASKSKGNFKKNKLNTIEQFNHNNSKSKSKKNISKKKINNIQKKKNNIDLNIKEDTPSRTEKKTEKNLLKLASTPKVKQKQIKRFSQINLEMTKTVESTQTLREKNSKTLVNSSKIKKMHSKSKIQSKKIKKEEKKENQENINDISVENKIKEIKIENVILSDKDLKNENFEEEKKKSINDKILLDEEILNNVNKDELLISTIKTEKINETENNNIDNNNMDNNNMDNNNNNLIKDFSLKESNSTNIDINNNLIKGQSSEINNSLNSFNKSNNDINNIKLINSNNEKKEEKKKEKYKSNICDLDNIVLPKRITNFLDNDKEINFSLINNSQNEFDNNDQEFNKTIDLNISGLSEHLSLEEKFEGHLDEITRFLDINDLCKLMLVNKECYKTIMNILISKTEITIDILEEEISKIKESNKDINYDELKINPFKFNENSSRAVFLLNNNTDFNLVNINNKMSREIFIIFGIFFIAIGKKKEYINLITDEQKMNYTNNYFKKDISLGTIIEKEIKGKIFDDKIIASLYKYSYRYLNIISPNRFQKINKDFAIFVFVIKNILEHIGALEEKNEPQKEYILYNARLKNNKEILEILNGYFDKIE